MPSLRRTISSPSVRPSPYPSSLSLAARNPVPRRSSGSDTSSRRVLADIDWWRVEEGQQGHPVTDEEDVVEAPVPQDPSDVDELSMGVALSGPPGLAPADRSDRPSSPALPAVPEALSSTQLVFQDFIALANPRTPFRRSTSQSSASSVESSPELPPTPRERLSFADMGFADPGSDDAPIFRLRPAALAFKSHSFSEFTTEDKDIGIFRGLADPIRIHDHDLFA
ncbi:hypothetical protein OF83DRAFT_1081835 [Amylostereum chailletii]|nr:hypothetical protein OF83DRAFT_1081835 [Amylostereum chailletii]